MGNHHWNGGAGECEIILNNPLCWYNFSDDNTGRHQRVFWRQFANGTLLLEQQPKAIATNSGEGPYQALGDEAGATGDFGSTPVIVLSAGHDALPPMP